jgi:hypothetical protein
MQLHWGNESLGFVICISRRLFALFPGWEGCGKCRLEVILLQQLAQIYNLCLTLRFSFGGEGTYFLDLLDLIIWRFTIEVFVGFVNLPKLVFLLTVVEYLCQCIFNNAVVF